MRVYRVSRIQSTELTDEHFERPDTFDLVAFWNEWSATFEKSLYPYPVTLRVASESLSELSYLFGDWVQTRQTLLQSGSPDEQGRITLSLYFESLSHARSHLLGFGTSVRYSNHRNCETAWQSMRCALRNCMGSVCDYGDLRGCLENQKFC